MRRFGFSAVALLLALMAGCASTPVPLGPECLVPGDPRVTGQFMLDVRDPQASRELLIVSQWRQDHLHMLGFNAVGAQLFEAVLEAGEVKAAPAPLYRGPRPEPLLWGLLVHQLRDDLQECLAADDLHVQKQKAQPQKPLVVMQQNRRLFSSRASGSFALPEDGIVIDVRRLQ